MTWTQSQRQVFGSVRGVTWGKLVPPFQFVALFFFMCTGKAVHFLNIQKAPIASTTFWKNSTVFRRGHPEKWQNLPTVK